MIPHIGATQETMENIDPNDTMIPTDTIKAINRTALDQLIDFRDTNREAQANTETTRAIIMTSHAHQVVFASEIDAHDGITSIHVLTRPYAACHVLDVTVQHIYLQI